MLPILKALPPMSQHETEVRACCRPHTDLSLAEKQDLVKHVEDLESWLVDGEDDSAIGAGHAVQVVKQFQG